ncbi:MAG: PAS domain S-box protein, partial [Methanomassiliicoccales archaeon]|nr:PAS domain S-box protein [Methanomassiliicoccales archaeon]
MISILYVDDEEDLLVICKDYLERSSNIKVDVASSGVEADRILSEKCYDVIVADYQMPIVSGIDLLKSIRARKDQTPFILFTGKGREEVVIEALNSGADFYLQKGGDPKAQFAELESKICVAVKRVRAEGEVEKERKRAQKYLDIAGVILVALDAEGKITLMNKRGYQILACDGESAIGKSWVDRFVPERNRNAVEDVYRKMMAGQASMVEYYENPVLTERGDERIIAWHNSVIMDNCGSITGTLSSGEDITNKRKVEQDLLEVKERYESLRNHILEIFFVIDLEGNLLEANQPAIDLTGFSRGELFSTNIFSLIPQNRLHPVLTAIDEMKRVGAQRRLAELQLRRKDGRLVEVEISGSLLFRDGVPYAIQGIARDITERKVIQEKLEASESRYRRLFETAQDGILILDQDSGKVIDANPFILHLTGY